MVGRSDVVAVGDGTVALPGGLIAACRVIGEQHEGLAVVVGRPGDPPPDPPGEQLSWCSARHLVRLIGTRGGVRRSEIVPLHLEVTARGATGMLIGRLQQAVLVPGAGVLLLWLIGKEQGRAPAPGSTPPRSFS